MNPGTALAFVLMCCASGGLRAGDFLSALEQGDASTMAGLLKDGANANQRDSSGRPALIAAILQQRPDMVGLLLDNGADPNGEYQSERAITFAAVQPRCPSAIVSALLQRGARPNVSDPVTGTTPLLSAAGTGSAKCVELLIRAGAKVDAEDSLHATTVWKAALGGNPALVEGFIKLGVNPNRPTSQGVTPLMVGAASGNRQVVELLLQYHADACALDVRGRSAHDMAAKRGYVEVTELLPRCPSRPPGSARSQ